MSKSESEDPNPSLSFPIAVTLQSQITKCLSNVFICMCPPCPDCDIIEVSPPSILGSSVSILARRVRKLMLAHPARLTAKSVLFDEEYTGLYSFSVAHT